ncbi:hypothetical protein CPB85DRAFT_1429036 [Mucidula mucida]|nr:hypothetical protein CPB85DRAFT_1429036 [Mucidula mucida]
MSSKRGRKRNDNLPPNRARDVQRAFRARRAAHLQALEQRVTELEEENNCERPPLGKGPTGKDKPKFDQAGSLNGALTMRGSRDSSSSPDSTRASSLSPATLTSSVPSRSVPDMEGGTWDQTLLLSDHQSDVPSSSASSSYPLPPMNPQVPKSYHSYPSPVPPSRNALPGASYISSQASYSHSDRQLSAGYNTPSFNNNNMRDVREEPRSHYSYSTQPSFHDHPLPSQTSPTSTPPIHTSSYHSNSPREPALPYPHRRSMTDPQQGFSIGQGFPHLPHPAQPHHTAIRLPSPPVVHAHMPRNAYGPDGRITRCHDVP